MKGSILIYGGNKRNRVKEIIHITENLHLNNFINNPDVLEVKLLEKKRSIGIEQTRASVKFINEKPYNHKNKVAIIYEAQKLTIPAQNSLLKTLEEHSDYASIIIESQSQKDLLSTIVSRCQRIDVSKSNAVTTTETLNEEDETFHEIKLKGYGERLVWAEEFSKEDRDYITQTLQLWIEEGSISAINSGSSYSLSDIDLIDKVKKDMEKTNINARLSLEYLVLNLS